jgi:hypothetical protein
VTTLRNGTSRPVLCSRRTSFLEFHPAVLGFALPIPLAALAFSGACDASEQFLVKGRALTSRQSGLWLKASFNSFVDSAASLGRRESVLRLGCEQPPVLNFVQNLSQLLAESRSRTGPTGGTGNRGRNNTVKGAYKASSVANDK